jgi:hypothetical protein
MVQLGLTGHSLFLVRQLEVGRYSIWFRLRAPPDRAGLRVLTEQRTEQPTLLR